MSTFDYFVGIDVSKNHLDLSLCQQGQSAPTKRIPNQIEAIQKYIQGLGKQYDLNKTIFCMEATGMYTAFLISVLVDKKLAIWVENPIHIKRSSGLQRGKNDTIDAQRIGQYAHRFQDKVCLYQPKSKILEETEHLNRLRTRLVQTRKKLQTALSETMQFVDKTMAKSLEMSSQKTMNALEKDIQNLETKIQKLIFSDSHLKQLYQLTLSVQGVGKVTATQILIKTQGFTKFKTPRQFASYCGVVPFEHSSGKFRGKERVSHMADKQLKSLLHMCAVAAIKHQGELKTYYLRKTEEGKAKMAVINAIRNKIIQRIFACVKNKQPYQKNYQNHLLFP